MILLSRRFLRTTPLFSTDMEVPRKSKNLLRRYFVFTSDYEGRALEQVWSVCSLFSLSKPPQSPQHRRRFLARNLLGFDLFLRTFQTWTLPWQKPLLPVAFNKTFCAKIQNLSLHKYLGNVFIPGAPSHTCGACSLPAECPEPQNNPWISQDSCNGF